MEGLSTRSISLNVVMEFVILLYLFEEDASWLVKVTAVSECASNSQSLLLERAVVWRC